MKTATKPEIETTTESAAVANRFTLDSRGPRSPEENRRFQLSDIPLESLSDETTLGELREIVAQKFPHSTAADLRNAIGFLTQRLTGMDLFSVLAEHRGGTMALTLQAQPSSVLALREIVNAAFPAAKVQ